MDMVSLASLWLDSRHSPRFQENGLEALRSYHLYIYIRHGSYPCIRLCTPPRRIHYQCITRLPRCFRPAPSIGVTQNLWPDRQRQGNAIHVYLYQQCKTPNKNTFPATRCPFDPKISRIRQSATPLTETRVSLLPLAPSKPAASSTALGFFRFGIRFGFDVVACSVNSGFC